MVSCPCFIDYDNTPATLLVLTILISTIIILEHLQVQAPHKLSAQRCKLIHCIAIDYKLAKHISAITVHSNYWSLYVSICGRFEQNFKQERDQPIIGKALCILTRYIWPAVVLSLTREVNSIS